MFVVVDSRLVSAHPSSDGLLSQTNMKSDLDLISSPNIPLSITSFLQCL